MKLYSSIICFGLLGLIIICPKEETLVVSDFCKQSKDDIARLKNLTTVELAALQRPRKEAITSLRRTYQRECVK